MSQDKTIRAAENCYVTAFLYAVIFSAVLLFRNQASSDRLIFVYGGSALGMALLFLSFPFAFRDNAESKWGLVLRSISLLCFVGSIVAIIFIGIGWYKNQFNFRFNPAGLIVYLAGLGFSLFIILAKTSKLGKGLRKTLGRINSTAVRNFLAASVILTFIELSLLFSIDILTQMIGLIAFMAILTDQSLSITRLLIARHRN